MRTSNFYFATWYKQVDLTGTATQSSTLFKEGLVFINFLLWIFITFSVHAMVLLVKSV